MQMYRSPLQVHTVEKKQQLCVTIHIRICVSIVIQLYKLHGNPISHVRICIQYYNSLASYAFCREQGSGHVAADELSLRNAIIEQCSLIKC